MVIPFLDVSKEKQTDIEKQTSNPENITNNNHPNQRFKKCSTFSGTTNIYQTNELSIPTPFLKGQIIETNLSLLISNTLQGENPLHMTIMTVKIQTGGLMPTLDLLLQTATTMNTILVILEKVRDQLFPMRILQRIDLNLHTEETNHQP